MYSLKNKKYDKKLLAICHSYNSFQKDQIDLLSPNFSSVNVLVRINPFADIGKFFPFLNLEGFSSKVKINKNHIPPNAHVYPTEVWYLPTDCQYKNLGNRHLSAVEAQIREHKIVFDMIHAHFIWSSGFVGAKLKERYGIPLVITAHGYDVYSLPFKDAVWRKNIEYVLNTADAIITVSHSNLDCIRQLDVNTPVHIIPNGFRKDLFFPRDPFTCRQQLNLPMNKKILLTIGYLDFTDKGQNYLIEAIREMIQVRCDFLCVIIGMGKDKRALEKQIMSFGLCDYVMLLGGKPHDEIPLWINACDVFVLPSLNEGNPTVMFEVLGCGKPFVGTKVGGVPEIISSDMYGLLVEPADSKELAAKILVALEMKWDREKILVYAERFTWENISKEILKIYQIVGIRTERNLEKE